MSENDSGKKSALSEYKKPSLRAKPDQTARAAVAKAMWGFGFVLFAIALTGVWWLLKLKYDANTTPESYSYVAKFEKEGIPSIEATDLDGKPFDLSRVATPIVIVNFWASWCGPCVEEFPSMLRLIAEMKGKVTIVAVSMDDDEKDLRAFTKLFKVPKPGFEVLWDKDKKVMGTYGVGKLPESYIVGPDRKLIRKVLGIENWATPNAIQYFTSLAEKGLGAPKK
jgi:thiol-disulfide isomerase/thioredoxin